MKPWIKYLDSIKRCCRKFKKIINLLWNRIYSKFLYTIRWLCNKIKEKSNLLRENLYYKVLYIIGWLSNKIEKAKYFIFKRHLRAFLVIFMGVLSFPITLSVIWIIGIILNNNLNSSIDKILEYRGSWVLITLIFSSPVAFVIWYFRDENTIQQIENHRKDVNLKEFQKISEWVSGIHLSEEDNNEEKIEGNAKKNSQTNSITYNKYNGAIALQISSIHGLLPFLRGDHGESFKKPALNLLKSAWHMLHYNDLQGLKECEDIDKARNIIRNINKRSHDAVGSSLMQVFLADGGEYLHQHPEVFSFICLSGINIHLPGLHYNLLKRLFYGLENATNIQLQAAFLDGTFFTESKMQGANFQYSQLDSSSFDACNLYSAKFYYSCVRHSHFKKTRLIKASFKNTDAAFSRFEDCNLEDAEFINTNFEGSKFVKANLSKSNLSETILKDAYFENVCLESTILTSADLRNSVLKEVNLNNANLQDANLEGSCFSDVSMIGANLIGTKGLTIKMLDLIDDIEGVIFYGSNFLHSEWDEYIKLKNAIVVMGKRNTLLSGVNKNIILIAKNIKKKACFKHELSNFDIDFSATKSSNPDWIFEVKDKE